MFYTFLVATRKVASFRPFLSAKEKDIKRKIKRFCYANGSAKGFPLTFFEKKVSKETSISSVNFLM